MSVEAGSVRSRTARLVRALGDQERGRFTKLVRDYDHREPAAEAFLEAAGEPWWLRVAAAQAASWVGSDPVIRDDELIVGVECPPRVVDTHYTVGLRFNREMARTVLARSDSQRLSAVIRSAGEQLQGRTAGERIEQWCAERGLTRTNDIYWAASFQGHMVLDWAKLLRVGVGGLIEEATEWERQHSGRGRRLARAARVLAEGLRDFIAGYAVRAEEMAAGAAGSRADELRQIARICRRISTEPAASFHEALQLFWFGFLYDGSDNPGRIDQWLHPYLQADLESGAITPDEAEELLEALWVKFNEVRGWNLVLGGQTPDGEDASNELTGICLDITERLGLPAPNVSVRWFHGTPGWLRERSIEVVGRGLGMPAIYNDEVIVPALTRLGIAIEDARDYAFGGCTEIQIPGKSNLGGEDANLNLAKCLELALNDGVDMRSGTRLGPRTGDPWRFDTFEQLYGAWQSQLRAATDAMIEITNMAQSVRSECGAKLFRALLTADCLERGLDPDGGGARYGHGEVMTLGIAVTADSLAAIREFVYHRGSVSMGELHDALKSDFDGRERLRLALLRDAPKYGNDIAGVDALAARVAGDFWRLLRRYSTHRGGRYGGGVIVLGRNIPFGAGTAATPDGRHAGEPLEDAVGPRAGMARRGPSAALRSAARIDQTLGPMGVLYNLTLPEELFEETTRSKVQRLVEGYFADGGQQVQITVASAERLRAAQANPEAHRDLIVRVGGYSDYFVRLSPELQEDIIARTRGAGRQA